MPYAIFARRRRSIPPMKKRVWFPRLRSLDRPELQTMLERINSLENDHARANRSHAEVDRLGHEWLTSGSLAPLDAERFSRIVSELAELYRDHIRTEEHEL